MTITNCGTVSVGATLTATATATASINALAGVTVGAAAAIDALAGLTAPEIAAKLQGYLLMQVPSPSFDISLQLATATSALATAVGELTAMVPTGPGLALALTGAVAAQAAAQLAIKGYNSDVALKIDAALASIASLQVQMSAGVSGPNINLVLIAEQIANLLAAQASITAQAAVSASATAAASAQASVAAGIDISLGVSGLRLYRFDGDISTAGAELQAQVTADGLSGELHFVLMLPTNPAAWTALRATVKTS
jgi:hypothetical protein